MSKNKCDKLSIFIHIYIRVFAALAALNIHCEAFACYNSVFIMPSWFWDNTECSVGQTGEDAEMKDLRWQTGGAIMLYGFCNNPDGTAD